MWQKQWQRQLNFFFNIFICIQKAHYTPQNNFTEKAKITAFYLALLSLTLLHHIFPHLPKIPVTFFASHMSINNIHIHVYSGTASISFLSLLTISFSKWVNGRSKSIMYKKERKTKALSYSQSSKSLQVISSNNSIEKWKTLWIHPILFHSHIEFLIGSILMFETKINLCV